MKVLRIEFKDEMGNPNSFDVTYKGIKEITEHPAQGDGDKWFYNVVFENGDEIMVFNPTQVFKRQGE